MALSGPILVGIKYTYKMTGKARLADEFFEVNFRLLTYVFNNASFLIMNVSDSRIVKCTLVPGQIAFSDGF